MTATTYSFQCPCCGKVETANDDQAYVIIVSKGLMAPRTYEICSECRQDMYDLMEGRGEKVIEQLEQEPIPTPAWGHHE